MIRILKYLKPYTLFIVINLVLLFIQANADLALPDYMSRIVNTGIQQGGVENAVPQAIRQSQMKRVLLFLDEAETERVLGDYTLIEQGSASFDSYRATYPGLAKEPVYVLNAVSDAEIAWLDPVMASGLLAVSGVEEMIANPEKAAEAAAAGFDLSRLPEGTDAFSALAQLPEAQRAQIRSALDEQFAALGDSMLVQAAVPVVRNEYEALGADTDALQNRYLLKTGGLMLLISLVAAFCMIMVGFFSARTSSGLARDLRKLVFQKVESFSSTEFNRFSTASLITRTTNDITQIQMVVMMMMRMFLYAPIMGVGGILRAMDKGSSMWWLIALAVALLVSLVAVVFSLSLPKFRIMQELIDRLNLVFRESLSGMMVIRAFNRQPNEALRIDKANTELTDNTLFVGRVMATMFPSMTLIMNALSVAIIWVGAHQVAEANMQVGDMMAFLQYAMQIVFSFLMMSFMFIILPRASVSGGRVADVLDTEIRITDPEQPRKFPEPFVGTVEFRNVSFRYPGADENVLEDISFITRPGQTTAFIGSTGSGKSSVINLIPRFYDVSEGAILIDGVDIRLVTQHDLREKIGYIPQQSTLFSGTIESNLRYADDDASPEALQEAIETAQADEFISQLPDGLASEISQGGTNVSGGQKQRISIARALVKRAPIYIFDDSFSALDFKTDAALRSKLKEKALDNYSAAVLIVTQRVSTIRNAEQIIVLDEGKIVGKGTHEELMAGCETYREIALSQLSAEELA